MLRNYLLIAFRNLLRHKVCSLINLSGLAIGMAACLLILQYVSFEWSYDNFHEKGDRIYRVGVAWYRANGELEEKVARNFGATGPAMQREFPEVEAFVRFQPWYGNTIIRHQDTALPQERIYFADPSVFTMFSFPVLKGDAVGGLAEMNAAALSETTAQKYFGRENPIGKVIELQRGEFLRLFTVKAVFQDIPANAHLKFDVLLSYVSLGEVAETSWGGDHVHTYLLLKPKVDVVSLQRKFPALLEKYRDPEFPDSEGEAAFVVHPLRDIHLHSDLRHETEPAGNGWLVTILSFVGLIILVIAYTNYTNLATARAVERSKEVGVRKVIGATRLALVKQFLLESLLLNAIAFFLAVTIAQGLFQVFRGVMGQPSGSTWQSQPLLWGVALGLFLLGALVSGLYPAFILSSFKPVSALKGKGASFSGGTQLRKSLVVFQFGASVVLIAVTLVVYRQLAFMQNQELGYDPDQIVVVKGPIVKDSAYVQKVKRFKAELTAYPEIQAVTGSVDVPGQAIQWSQDGIRRKDVASGEAPTLWTLSTDYDFVETYGLKIIAGRSFDEGRGTDRKGLVINEEAARVLGFASPEAAVDQPMVWEYRSDGFSIIGVVKNFHQTGLKDSHDPMLIFLNEEEFEFFSCRIKTANLNETLQVLQQEYTKFFPGNPFDYFFLDEFFARQYETDHWFGQVFMYFTSTAIFLSCLGLLGLVSLVSSQRQKEIGIRKVLGASLANILVVLNKDLFKLVVLANLLAWPLAWWGMLAWLQQYAFRIDLSPWLFVGPSLLVLLIALLTVSAQTWQAARANPVKSLRSE